MTQNNRNIALMLEIKQLFEELKALQVGQAVIGTGTKILCMRGELDKIQARLRMDPEPYPSKSSPTVAIQSVCTMLARIPESCHGQQFHKLTSRGHVTKDP